MFNKLLQRIFLLLLPLTMSFGTFSVSYVKAENSQNDGFEKKLEVLQMLEIVDKNISADSISDEQVISRAEFARYFFNFLNITKSNYGTLYYYDVAKDYYAYDEITALTELGYIKGVNDKEFDPEANMRSADIYKLFLKAIGAEEVLAIKGGAVNDAKKLCYDAGLLDGVYFGENVTYKSFFIMMYNTLLTKCYGMDFSGNYGRTEDTFLKNTRDMEYVKRGNVTSVGRIDLYGVAEVENVTIIDGLKYYLPDFNITMYLGRQVEFIYEVDMEDDVEGKIVWINATKSDDTLSIVVNPECSYDEQDGVLTYYDSSDKKKRVKIPKSIVMIYNGRFRESGINEVLASDRYEMTLIKDSGGEYSTAVVSQYENYVVDTINIDDNTIYSLDKKWLKLDFQDYIEFKILDPNNVEVEFSDIAKGDVLSVYKSQDGECCEVRISRNAVVGNISSIDEEIVDVNGEKLEFYKWDETIGNYFGKTLTFYIDIKGFIAGYYSAPSTEQQVGFMINCTLAEDEAAGEEKLYVKILTAEGKVVRYTSSDRIKVNGINFKNEARYAFSEIADADGKVTPQMIAYKLNTDSDIVSLDVASKDDGGDHPLTINARAVVEEQQRPNNDYKYYLSKAGKLGERMIITSDTKIFQVPDEETIKNNPDEKYFIVRSSLPDGQYEGAISYRTTRDYEGYEEYLLVRSNNVQNKLGRPVMLKSIRQGLNSNDDVVDFIEVYTAEGVLKELTVEKNCDFASYEYKKGDIFRYGVSAMTGEITNVETVYQPSKNIINESGGYTAENRIFIGYLNNTSEISISCGYESGAEVSENFNMLTYSAKKTVIFDEDDDFIYVSNLSDLKPYNVYGDKCSKVILDTNYGRVIGFFAIQ